MIITPLPITNKYFINSLQAATGMTALLRGKILGPIVHDTSTFYLCDIYPSDESVLAITTQMILGIEQFAGVYLYDDREIMDLEWQRIVNELRKAQLRRTAAAARKRNERAGGLPFTEAALPDGDE